MSTSKINDLRTCCDVIFFSFQCLCTQFFNWKSFIFSYLGELSKLQCRALYCNIHLWWQKISQGMNQTFIYCEKSHIFNLIHKISLGQSPNVISWLHSRVGFYLYSSLLYKNSARRAGHHCSCSWCRFL